MKVTAQAFHRILDTNVQCVAFSCAFSILAQCTDILHDFFALRFAIFHQTEAPKLGGALKNTLHP